MKQFEYKKVKFDNHFLELGLLSLEGENGWELVCFKTYITDVYAYFKREIPEDTHKPFPP